MVYAIPLFLYVEANSPQEAMQHKHTVERLLNQPFLKTAIQSQGIPERGFVVGDPQVPQQR